MKTQHRPGPWKAVELDEYTVAIKTDRNHTHECIHIADAHIMSGNLAEEVPMAIANAKLIAAAPELLEALIDAYMVIYGGNSLTIDEAIKRSPKAGRTGFEQKMIDSIEKATL